MIKKLEKKTHLIIIQVGLSIATLPEGR